MHVLFAFHDIFSAHSKAAVSLPRVNGYLPKATFIMDRNYVIETLSTDNFELSQHFLVIEASCTLHEYDITNTSKPQDKARVACLVDNVD